MRDVSKVYEVWEKYMYENEYHYIAEFDTLNAADDYAEQLFMCSHMSRSYRIISCKKIVKGHLHKRTYYNRVVFNQRERRAYAKDDMPTVTGQTLR